MWVGAAWAEYSRYNGIIQPQKSKGNGLNFYSAAYMSERLHGAKQLFYRGLGDRNSVRLSVTRALWDEMKEHTANILTIYERIITVVFWYQHKLVGDVPFYLKFALKVTQPPLNNADFDQYLRITSEQ